MTALQLVVTEGGSIDVGYIIERRHDVEGWAGLCCSCCAACCAACAACLGGTPASSRCRCWAEKEQIQKRDFSFSSAGFNRPTLPSLLLTIITTNRGREEERRQQPAPPVQRDNPSAETIHLQRVESGVLVGGRAPPLVEKAASKAATTAASVTPLLADQLH